MAIYKEKMKDRNEEQHSAKKKITAAALQFSHS